MNETFQELTGCKNEELANHFINKAILAVTKYVNNPSIDVEDSFSIAIIELACYYYMNKKNIGVSSMSQGDREVTFIGGSNEIPSEIKALLPHYVTVV